VPSVLVTGANRGIGLAFVRQYAASGFRVFATCRNPDGADRLKTVGGDVRIHALNVRDEAQIADLAKTLAEEPLDILINNAGTVGSRKENDSDPTVWLRTFRTNAIAPVRIAQSLAPNLERGREKKIVSISSGRASIGANTDGGLMIYRTSKAALNMAVRCLAAEMKERGLIVVALAPGWVKTRIGGTKAPLTPEQSVEAMRAAISKLEPGHSGGFFDRTGEPLQW